MFSIEKCKQSKQWKVVGSIYAKTYYINGYAVHIEKCGCCEYGRVFRYDETAQQFLLYSEVYPSKHLYGFEDCRRSIAEKILNEHMLDLIDYYNDKMCDLTGDLSMLETELCETRKQLAVFQIREQGEVNNGSVF